MSSIVGGFIVPGLPHLVLAPEKNPGWMKLRESFERAKKEIEQSQADLIIIYSTYWASVIGHQIQARPMAEWTLVDDQFHDLGSIPYKLKMDSEFAEVYRQKCEDRGLSARTVDYHGFPIDTGSVVALKLLNPDNRIPAIIVSSNVYADRAETVVLGKAVEDALQETGKKAIAISISSLSNRLHTEDVDPKDDKISSLKDQEWNDKFLELLSLGQLEDTSQLSRQFHREARVNKVSNFKALWWLSATMGAHNNYSGEVLEYQPVCGTGAALIQLKPSDEVSPELEFDEDDPEIYGGDRNVLGKNPFEPTVEEPS